MTFGVVLDKPISVFNSYLGLSGTSVSIYLPVIDRKNNTQYLLIHVTTLAVDLEAALRLERECLRDRRIACPFQMGPRI